MSELDPLEQRRRQREAAKRRTLTLAILAGGAVMAGLIVFAAVMVVGKKGGAEVPGITSPSEGSEGENWTHKELVEYLAKKGVKAEVLGGGASQNGSVTSMLAPAGLTAARDKLDQNFNVYLCKDRQAAKELAGAGKSYAWGRFVLPSEHANPHADRLAKQIKAALGK